MPVFPLNSPFSVLNHINDTREAVDDGLSCYGDFFRLFV